MLKRGAVRAVATLSGLVLVSACVSEYDFGKKPPEPTLDSSQQTADPEVASDPETASDPVVLPDPEPTEELPAEPESGSSSVAEEDEDDGEEAAAQPSATPSPSPSPDSDPQKWSNCTTETIVQPSTPDAPYPLDLLFVMDTSISMDTEVGPVTTGLQSYLATLDPTIDTRVALLTADYASNMTGKLYSTSSIAAVFKLQTSASSNSPSTGVYKDAASLATYFGQLLNDAVVTHAGINTEFGLRSVYNSLHDDIALAPNLLTTNRGLGFFRTNAALAIITVGDEMDVCARSTTDSSKARTTNASEASLFNQYCLSPSITPDSVLSVVESIQDGRPYSISGIHYLPETAESKQEVGYGYLELIDAAGGMKIDLRDTDYTAELAAAAAITNKELQFTTEVQFADPSVDASSIAVTVDGVASTAFTYDSSTQTLALGNAGGAGSRVQIVYCVK